MKHVVPQHTSSYVGKANKIIKSCVKCYGMSFTGGPRGEELGKTKTLVTDF